MLRNYLVIAWRNIVHHKLYSLINVLGLAISMACCLLILLFVQDALSYDRFHTNADRIYRIAIERNWGRQIENFPLSPASMGPALIEALPEVIQATRIDGMFDRDYVISHQGKSFYEDGFLNVDPNFLEFFDFPLLQGNPETALQEPGSIVITQELGKKYFGDENPMGQTLHQHKTAYKITGIVEDIPHNSHLQFDALVPFWVRNVGENGAHEFPVYTYVLLGENVRAADVERKWESFIQSYAGAQVFKDLYKETFRFEPYLQPLTDIHLHSHLKYELSPNEDADTIYLFAAIAALILFIACVNYVNLATAQSARRSKEVGIRKVMGAPRSRLVRQFLGETLMVSLMALLLALICVELFLPTYGQFLGRELHLDFTGNEFLLPGMLGVALLIGGLAGIFPAFFLSAFQPVEALKGTVRDGKKSVLFRRVLVIVQFSISVGLIAITATMHRQLEFATNKDLGFNEEQVVVLPLKNGGSGSVWRSPENSLKRDLRENPKVLAVSGCSRVPGTSPSKTWVFYPGDGAENEQVQIATLYIDSGFIDLLKIELVAGRNFWDDAPDPVRNGFIVNEKAAQLLGVTPPLDARLKTRGSLAIPQVEAAIVGIVRDFHLESLYQEIEPLILRPHILSRSSYGGSPFNVNTVEYILVKIRPENTREILDFMKGKWEEKTSLFPFDYYFLNEDFARAYHAVDRQIQVFGFFSILAILVACLGLFGLASFSAEQRTKEIGIRKVLGASVANIVRLLSGDFLKLVLIANLLSWPIAYWILQEWLQRFAYRIDLGSWTFVVCGVLTLIIALVTVGGKAIKTALSNPVDALRYE